jgi:H(+)-translocating pyrophosphatase
MAHVFFPSLEQKDLAPHIVGFGFGASLVALFAQLGGGIYTKAADVGADIVGKIETNIPEDDPRNPAVIADLVGDNVGDCAGRGADLFESISAEIIGAMIIGGKLSHDAGIPNASFVFFPLLVHSFDLIVSSIGTFMVREMPSCRGRGEVKEPPIRILARGFIISLIFAFGGFVIATRWLLYSDKYPDAWWRFLLCGGVGMLLALFFLILTEYYTGYHHGPVARIAKASTTGDGTNVIAGLSVGMESAGIPVVLICAGILSAYNLGNWAMPNGGLFGTAVATMGMLSIAAFVLGMDTFGPITDNAGGIAEMSGQSARVREITDELDAVGNTTKALTKGWAIGSAGLAAFLLFQAYVDVVNQYSSKKLTSVDLSRPEVFSCGLLGAGLVVVFASMAIRAVGTAAGDVVEEVRRQFREHPGIMQGTDLPDYSECVSMIHKASLREMIKPGLTAILAPVVVALVYREIGHAIGDELLAASSLGGFLMIATTTGIVVSLFLNNAGGAWDNAKKLIETGLYGGKGSSAHKAAITGDCVGDPCKDTAGPSIHVLIKLLSTITLVLGPLFL